MRNRYYFGVGTEDEQILMWECMAHTVEEAVVKFVEILVNPNMYEDDIDLLVFNAIIWKIIKRDYKVEKAYSFNDKDRNITIIFSEEEINRVFS